MEDKTMKCKDCGADFIWTVGEQEFYQQKGLTHEPTRCPACRKARKQQRAFNPSERRDDRRDGRRDSRRDAE